MDGITNFTNRENYSMACKFGGEAWVTSKFVVEVEGGTAGPTASSLGPFGKVSGTFMT